jgi:ligand-binding SRPBCC domain-containing protein
MPIFDREVHVDAPFEDVWEFHSTGDGLVALTPDWMNLRIEETRGPDGGPDPEVLETGSVVVSSIRPFGIGPRQRWVSEIVARGRSEHEAMFRDVMVEGPFPEWTHTHRFRAVDGGTVVHDHVEYELPGGPIGKLSGPLGVIGMEPMFRFRHRETRALLES